MSAIAEKVYEVVKECFPYSVVIREYYVLFKGQRLFFDYYIKDMNMLIEVQGEQHFKYVRHFHGDINGFKKQKHRDNLKIEFMECNPDLSLAFFYDKKDKITRELVLTRLYEAYYKEF